MKVTKAVIPAAGLGTRMLPISKSVPKEMLPIVDKPAIQYLVEEAVASGITDILIVTGRNKEAIENHFDHSLEYYERLEKSGKTKQLEGVKAIADMANISFIRQRRRAVWGTRCFAPKLLSATIRSPFCMEMTSSFQTHR